MKDLIGMIVPNCDNSFFSSLAHFTERSLSEKGCRLFLTDCHNDVKREKEYLQSLSSICADIIDVSGLSELSEELLPQDYPLVFVDRKPSSIRKIPWVGNDDEAAMKEATEYLIEKGYIAQHKESPRVNGYLSALKEHGIEESHVLYRKGLRSSQEETRDIIMEQLSEGRKIDAIITSSDRSAFAVMKAIGELGYYAPEDVRLISFDNTPYSTLSSPSITSIDRNFKDIAYKAVEVMLDQINGKEVCDTNTIEVSLVKRDSSR